jgi:hypothetical protein
MTIYLSHPAAFAYDLLAIAAIKARRNPNDNGAKGNLMLLDEEIQRQVGVMHHEQVCASLEYQTLLRVNDEMYVRIDEMKTRTATGEDARYVDDRVYQRYLAKCALQQVWFPGSAMTEQKFGYAK